MRAYVHIVHYFPRVNIHFFSGSSNAFAFSIYAVIENTTKKILVDLSRPLDNHAPPVPIRKCNTFDFSDYRKCRTSKKRTAIGGCSGRLIFGRVQSTRY